jgi:hypothetical protein
LIDAVEVKRKWTFEDDSAAGARNAPRRGIPWNLTAEKGNQF